MNRLQALLWRALTARPIDLPLYRRVRPSVVYLLPWWVLALCGAALAHALLIHGGSP